MRKEFVCPNYDIITKKIFFFSSPFLGLFAKIGDFLTMFRCVSIDRESVIIGRIEFKFRPSHFAVNFARRPFGEGGTWPPFFFAWVDWATWFRIQGEGRLSVHNWRESNVKCSLSCSRTHVNSQRKEKKLWRAMIA